MKNNKGITLIELIISVSLISVVLVFLFQMFVDVRYSDNRTNYSRVNQQNRAIIIKTVQDDFLNYKLTGLTSEGSTSSKFVIKFSFGSSPSTSTLTVTSDTVTYTSVDSQTEKWTIPSGSGKYNVQCVKYNIAAFGDFFSIWFRIPLTFKKNSPNVIDDLEFSYIGKTTGLDLSKFQGYKAQNNGLSQDQSLGNYNNYTCEN